MELKENFNSTMVESSSTVERYPLVGAAEAAVGMVVDTSNMLRVPQTSQSKAGEVTVIHGISVVSVVEAWDVAVASSPAATPSDMQPP